MVLSGVPPQKINPGGVRHRERATGIGADVVALDDVTKRGNRRVSGFQSDSRTEVATNDISGRFRGAANGVVTTPYVNSNVIADSSQTGNVSTDEVAQLLDGRYAGCAKLTELQTEIAAWSDKTNAKQRGVDWQFRIENARVKLKRLYPKIKT
jgi:hypothetical protein